jgi:hypothetical protein
MYPKAFYKSTYTPDSIDADQKTAHNAEEERFLLSQGYVDGHTFFSPPAPKPVKPERPKPDMKTAS